MKPAEHLANASSRNLCLLHSGLECQNIMMLPLYCLVSLWFWSDKDQTVRDVKALGTLPTISKSLAVVARYIKLLHKKYLEAWLDCHVSTALATNESFSLGEIQFLCLEFFQSMQPTAFGRTCCEVHPCENWSFVRTRNKNCWHWEYDTKVWALETGRECEWGKRYSCSVNM